MANITIDARPLTNPTDGIGRYTYEIVSRFVKHQKHTIFLYAHVPLLNRIKGAEMRTPSHFPGNGLICSQILFPRWIEKDEIDVFWSPRHHLPNNLRIPSVVTIHDLCWKLAPNSMPRLRRLSEQLLTPAAIHNASMITTVSHATQQDICASFAIPERKIRVVKPGLQPFAHTTAHQTNKPYILSVGTIEPRKNHKLLIQSFGRIRLKVPHDLVIIGRQGWGNVDIAKIAETEGLTDRVRWISDASDNQLASYYQGADLYVSCAIYEGFNLPILEAISCGTPVLATDIAVHREVAGSCAAYFSPDPAAVAELLCSTLSDQTVLGELASQCSSTSGKYDWEKSAEEMLAVILSVLK